MRYAKTVKLATEDNPQQPDDFLVLLSHLWRNDISVNANPVRGQLTIIGTSDEAIIKWVQRHYKQMEHWLPGRCDGCTEYALERTESYWGAHPHFCHRCLAWAIDYFERRQEWPEGNWFPGETFIMDDEDDEDDET